MGDVTSNIMVIVKDQNEAEGAIVSGCHGNYTALANQIRALDDLDTTLGP